MRHYFSKVRGLRDKLKDMPVAIVESSVVGPPLPRKRFTRSEVEAMEQAGLFAGQRFELIDGDLIDKMGQNPPHAIAIQRLLEIFVRLFGFQRVRGQSPMETTADRERSLPEPDVAVVREAKSDYGKRHPNGSETVLVIEVADTTLKPDLTAKRDLYARARVAEYWVVDLNGRRLIVHRDLDVAEAAYSNIQSYSELEEVALAGHSILVASMLP